jgi:phosphate transport system protein
MSPVDSGDPDVPLRHHYTSELQELKLSTEMMGVLVDQNLARMESVLLDGDLEAAERCIATDDEIDAMSVSLTEQCYLTLARENPVASDLRLVVSVVRVTAAFERVGDLSLRIAKIAPDQALIASNQHGFEILQSMLEVALARFRDALRAWGTDDFELAAVVSEGSAQMDLCMEVLTVNLVALEGPDAAAIAVRSLVVGQALQRISDHASVLGSRIQYLLTGDQRYLASEVR